MFFQLISDASVTLTGSYRVTMIKPFGLSL